MKQRRRGVGLVKKHYSTDAIFSRLGAELSNRVLAHLAGIVSPGEADTDWEGGELFADYASEPLRDAANAIFRQFNDFANAPRVKPTAIALLRRHAPKADIDFNDLDGAVLAAKLFISLPVDDWRQIVTMAWHFRVPESAWTTFKLEARVPKFPKVTDELCARLRKRVCETIYFYEGRADEGWCGYFADAETGDHCFTIDMTDHLLSRKERTARNRFDTVARKGVFTVMFRYKPELRELSVRADEPKSVCRRLCCEWCSAVLKDGDLVTEEPWKCELDSLLSQGRLLRIPEGSPVYRAEVVGFELNAGKGGCPVGWGSPLGSIREVARSAAQLTGTPLASWRVTKITVRFSYTLPGGGEACDERYFRRHATNAMHAPDALKPHIRPILELNGLISPLPDPQEILFDLARHPGATVDNLTRKRVLALWPHPEIFIKIDNTEPMVDELTGVVDEEDVEMMTLWRFEPDEEFMKQYQTIPGTGVAPSEVWTNKDAAVKYLAAVCSDVQSWIEHQSGEHLSIPCVADYMLQNATRDCPLLERIHECRRLKDHYKWSESTFIHYCKPSAKITHESVNKRAKRNRKIAKKKKMVSDDLKMIAAEDPSRIQGSMRRYIR